jgi:hypothetical protein
MKRLAGKITVNIDGTNYPILGSYTHNLEMTKMETVIGADGVILGYKETYKPAFIAFDTVDDGELPIDDIKVAKDVTVSAVLPNGNTAVVRNAIQVDDADYSAEDGKVALRFEGTGKLDVA